MEWCAFTIFFLMVFFVQLNAASTLNEWTEGSDENTDDDKEYYNYDGDYNDESNIFENNIFLGDGSTGNIDPPYFIHSKIVRYSRIGDNAILDCGAQNVQKNNVIIWYMDSIVIVNGLFVMKRNVEIMQNNSILINNVTKEDAGQYYCEILPEKIRMSAILNVDESLVIFCDGQDVTNRSLIFRQGEKHLCECKSYLLEDVEIKWFIDGQRAENIVPGTLKGQMWIENVDLKHNGIYQCLADDKSQEPPHGMIVVDVFFTPKVTTHRHHINTEPGGDAELYCDYVANPKAEVYWLKQNEILNDSYKYLVQTLAQKNRNRTILSVMDIHATDLGEYNCHIQNEIGVNKVNVFIIYEPEYPQLEDIRIEGKKVTLQWLVRSVQPLSEAVLNYKLAGAYTWSTVSVVHSYGHVKPHGVWKIAHEMQLTPGNWHVRMKSKNSAGWSQFSVPHDFVIRETGSEELADEPIREKMVVAASFGGKTTNSSTRKSLSTLIRTLTSILLYLSSIGMTL